MAKTNAEDAFFSTPMPNDIHGNSRLLRQTGARREYNAVVVLHVLQTNGIVAKHIHLTLHDITQIMVQVVSETVEIVDNQNAHARPMEVPKYS